MAKGTVEVHLASPAAESNELSTMPLESHLEFDPLMRSICKERLYAAWEELGYGYTGPFRAIHGASRRLGAAKGQILPADCGGIAIHPATLDAAIQTVLLAYCHPDDGRLWSVHVPRRIKMFSLNVGTALAVAGGNQSFHFISALPDKGQMGLCGDADLLTHDGRPLAQIIGVECVSLSPSNADNDARLFFTTQWAPASPDAATVCWDGRFDRIDDETMSALIDVLESCSTILWITHNAKDAVPAAYMSLGFFRTVLWEMPDTRLRTIDFVDGSEPESSVIAASLLEFELAKRWSTEHQEPSLLWSDERELVYRHGRFEIPRLVSNDAIDARYNASRRAIYHCQDSKQLRLSSSGGLA